MLEYGKEFCIIFDRLRVYLNKVNAPFVDAI